MLVIVVILLIATIAINKNDNSLLRGTLIPLWVLLIGGSQTFSRLAHINKVADVYVESPDKAIEQEVTKAEKDDKSYRNLKKAWVILIALAAILYIFVSNEYFKGLSIGLIALFLTALTVDSILHYRLKIYLEQLEKFIN